MKLPPQINQWIEENANDSQAIETLIRMASRARLQCACTETIVDKIEVLLQASETLSGINAMTISGQLYMSHRTLHRKLKREQITFQQVLDKERNKRCHIYLNHGDMKTEQIAELLGFSDVACFYRAYKRWHGSSFGVCHKKIALLKTNK